MTTPSITIVVPGHARPAKLAACLDALRRQEGGPYETIVVDDGSPEPLEPICVAAGSFVSVIRQANAGPASARNAGARAAAGAILCFTDDDCAPEPAWAMALAAAVAVDTTRLVGGPVDNALHDNLYSETSQSITNFLYGWNARHGRPASFFTTNNMACSRDAFLAIGGFDESFRLAGGEDREFGARWAREQGPLVYVPEAKVRHLHDLSAHGFWTQQANYGRGARQLHHTAPRKSEDPAEGRFEAPSFYAGLLLHPLRRHDLPWSKRLQVGALCCLSQLAIAKGYFDEAREEQGRAA